MTQYDDVTAKLLAEEAVDMANWACKMSNSSDSSREHIGAIACVSSPSVFRALKVLIFIIFVMCIKSPAVDML